tara:strand:- start:304 stop:612 length:309 start_codon:yes stop_codon:yes gene_type:complete
VTPILRSGTPPSIKAVTVSTPTTFKEFVLTLVTLRRVGKVKFESEYLSKFPVVTIPGKESDGFVTVETPLSTSPLVIEAMPIVTALVGIKSAVNVPAVPTIP